MYEYEPVCVTIIVEYHEYNRAPGKASQTSKLKKRSLCEHYGTNINTTGAMGAS